MGLHHIRYSCIWKGKQSLLEAWLDCFLDLAHSLDPIYIINLPFMTILSTYCPCNTLHYTTLHFTTLHCTALHYCTTLHWTTLHYTVISCLSCLCCDNLSCSHHMNTMIRCRLMVQGVRRVKRWACGSLVSILATTTMSCRTQWGKVTKVRRRERDIICMCTDTGVSIFIICEVMMSRIG